MTEVKTLGQLVGEFLLVRRDSSLRLEFEADLDEGRCHQLFVSELIHVPLQVHIEVFEHQIELVLGMDNIQQPVVNFGSGVSRSALDNVWVLTELLQETDLSDRR